MTLLEGARQGDHPEHHGSTAEERELRRIENHLLAEFAASVGRPAVSAAFRRAVAKFDGATVRLYVPLLSERAARQWIHDVLAQQTDVNASG